MAGAGDRDVSEARVKQVGVDAGVGVNENAFRGETLGAVTGDGVPMVEMAVLTRLELDLAPTRNKLRYLRRGTILQSGRAQPTVLSALIEIL